MQEPRRKSKLIFRRRGTPFSEQVFVEHLRLRHSLPTQHFLATNTCISIYPINLVVLVRLLISDPTAVSVAPAIRADCPIAEVLMTMSLAYSEEDVDLPVSAGFWTGFVLLINEAELYAFSSTYEVDVDLWVSERASSCVSASCWEAAWCD